MPAIAALTINDGAATPIAHTFSPVATNGSKAEWADRSPGIPAGYLTLSDEVRKPTGPGTAHRKIVGLNAPVTATVDGSLKVVRNSSAQVILNFAQDSTVQERKDLLAYVSGYLGNADVKLSIQNIESFW